MFKSDGRADTTGQEGIFGSSLAKPTLHLRSSCRGSVRETALSKTCLSLSVIILALTLQSAMRSAANSKSWQRQSRMSLGREAFSSCAISLSYSGFASLPRVLSHESWNKISRQ